MTPRAQIARALGASRRAVQAWVHRLQPGRSGGPARPAPPRPHAHLAARPGGPLPGADRRPAAPRGRGLRAAGADIRRILEEEFAARYTPDGVYKLLHRLGYSDLMPRPQHPESCPEAQEFFKEIVVEHIAAIAEQHPDAKVEVWHQDEARFGQKGTLTRVWARRGSRPRRVRQEGRESLYVLTAVCAASGAAVGLVMPELNTAVVNLFLEEFSRRLAPGVHARAAVGQRGLPHQRGPGGAGEREPDRAAAVLAGVEPGGEPVALPAFASLVPPGVPGLRGLAATRRPSPGGPSAWTRRRSGRSVPLRTSTSADNFSGPYQITIQKQSVSVGSCKEFNDFMTRKGGSTPRASRTRTGRAVRNI